MILDAAREGAIRSFQTSVVNRDGGAADQFSYPIDAFRELIANALVHRDLDAWSEGMAIEVRLLDDRLVVSNPGGLYGITSDRLGSDGTTSARNGRLVEICRYVRTPSDMRVVEALATGIPLIMLTCDRAGLPAPRFHDAGIRFTAVLTQPTPVAPCLGLTERRVYEQLGADGVTVTQIEAVLDLRPPTIRRALRQLRALGLAELDGGRGKRTTYRRLDG